MSTIGDLQEMFEQEGFEDASLYYDHHGWSATLNTWASMSPGSQRAGWGRFLSTEGAERERESYG